MTSTENSTDTENQPTRAQQWVDAVNTSSETDLAENLSVIYQYFIDHVDEFENGNVYPDDLPTVLSDIERIYTWVSVSFGTRIAAETTLYVLTGDNNRFISVYGIKEHAEERASDDPEISISEREPVGNDPEQYVSWARDRDEEAMSALADSLEFIHANRDAFLDGAVNADELPHASERASYIISMSTLFGVLWEYSHPSIYVILGTDNEFHGVYANESTAETHLELVEDNTETGYVQRVSITDGDLDPEMVME